jgi:predicted fused transcriptional regulator/phosphomethylpyrimidine kinase
MPACEGASANPDFGARRHAASALADDSKYPARIEATINILGTMGFSFVVLLELRRKTEPDRITKFSA